MLGQMTAASNERIPLSTMRHSAAHVLAQALADMFPGIRLAIGPDTENGFFYDVLSDPPLRCSVCGVAW